MHTLSSSVQARVQEQEFTDLRQRQTAAAQSLHLICGTSDCHNHDKSDLTLQSVIATMNVCTSRTMTWRHRELYDTSDAETIACMSIKQSHRHSYLLTLSKLLLSRLKTLTLPLDPAINLHLLNRCTSCTPKSMGQRLRCMFCAATDLQRIFSKGPVKMNERQLQASLLS